MHKILIQINIRPHGRVLNHLLKKFRVLTDFTLELQIDTGIEIELQKTNHIWKLKKTKFVGPLR